MRFVPGDAVGPYRVTEVIGEGAAGVVYRVVNSVTGRLEAMKILADGYTHDLEQAQRFLREIQLQAKLDHPNIAQVRTAFCDGTTIVLIMELVDGESLSSILQRGRLPLPVAIRITQQVLHALALAHHHGVIHRDVKPANILVNQNGVVKLTDFGLAKQHGEPGQTGQGMAVGTVFYMAPEQVRGLAATDWRCDLYAVGVVLYEMLCGRRPFDGVEQYAVMRAQIEQTPLPVTHWVPGLPRECGALLERALQKDPDRRFPSANGFLAALQALPTEPVQQTKRRRWQPAATAAGISCVLLAAFAAPPLPSLLPLEVLPLAMPRPPAPPPEAYRIPLGTTPATAPVPVAPSVPRTAPPTERVRNSPAAAPFRATQIEPSTPARLYEPPPSPAKSVEPGPTALPTPPKVILDQGKPPAEMPTAVPALPAEKPAHWMRRGLSRVPKLFRRHDTTQEQGPVKK